MHQTKIWNYGIITKESFRTSNQTFYNENIDKEFAKAREASQWIKAVLEKENQK